MSVDTLDRCRPRPQPAEANQDILSAIEKAAHLLPSQGPITAFVHHNTLHALEEFDFDTAVQKGGKLFSCEPYLSETDYRQHLAEGRIRKVDVVEVINSEFSAEQLSQSFCGSSASDVAHAIFFHQLHDSHVANLDWVIGDTEALNHFRFDVPQERKKNTIDRTQQWVMRDLRIPTQDSRIPEAFQPTLDQLFELFSISKVESWTPDQWESFVLHLSWKISEFRVERSGQSSAMSDWEETILRPRDWLFEASGEDPDDLVNQILIPFCSAFIDQGFSSWELPNRDQGFFKSFVELHFKKSFWDEPWKSKLRSRLASIRAEGCTAVESIEHSLHEFGIADQDVDDFICKTLLSLRGFSGIIHQLEVRSDRASRGVPEGSLIEFTAIKLLLDQYAFEDLAARNLNYRGKIGEFSSSLNLEYRKQQAVQTEKTSQTLRLFELGQILGWLPEDLLTKTDDREIQSLLEFKAKLSGVERRRLFHLAYERNYRNATLDAVLVHNRRLQQSQNQSETEKDFQIVCCLDEREESFRRHLEETHPDCETFGAAGFFAVPMYYRGAADAHYIPLCPVVIQPDCYVKEEPVYSLKKSDEVRRKARKTIGTVTHRAHLGSRTFTGGWLGTALLGCLATFPLVMRVLFPRLTARIRKLVGGFIKTPEVTRLTLYREEGNQPGNDDHANLGFTCEEMTNAVMRLLKDIGVQSFSRLFFICGHGSASLNNPHESAHDCGACAGGRGGPNARAFAQMANDASVRKNLESKGYFIPSSTRFIGCYHNTCDDGLTFYDLDQLPYSHQKEFEAAAEALHRARKLDAHERCRRFESCRLDSSLDDALAQVEARAEDLSQVRPEYGHATNALCFVGRRQWSKGLFLDRRAFLQSYDPDLDDENSSILERVLQAVIPVCAGINLEYYFSFVDSTGYGSGTKLPHNITSLIGVMNGAMSDLRTGLPWQMVEIHEPVRILFLVECRKEAILDIIARNHPIQVLVDGNWIQLAVFNPASNAVEYFADGEFTAYRPENEDLACARSSADWYRGWRQHLDFASVGEEFSEC